MGGTVGVRAPCVGVCRLVCALCPNNAAWLAQPGQRHTRASVFAEESVASRSVLVFGHRERVCVCLLAYKAASSHRALAQSWRLERHARDLRVLAKGTLIQRLSNAAGTRANLIDNRVMAKKTKAKAPAKKPSASKAKKPSAGSSGSVVEVEACKS